jgi:hypothetical protein
LITKAIKERWRFGHRSSPGRWQISRRNWSDNFFLTLITKPRLPSLPRGELISTREVANHLKDCGMANANQRKVRQMIKSGQLEGAHRSPQGLKWFVKRKSLKEFRKKFKKPVDRLF